MKLFVTMLLLCLLVAGRAYGMKGDTLKQTFRICKCQVYFGNLVDTNADLSKAEIDTISGYDAFPSCLELSTTCPRDRVIRSFEMVIAVGGFSKTFVSNGACLTGEMKSAIGASGGARHFIFQNILMRMPDGKLVRLPGKTIYIKR